MADKNIICSAYFPKTDTHALVQEENDCVYLYMYIRPDQDDQEIRASWVRNYGKAIDAVDKKAMDNGLQPRYAHERHASSGRRSGFQSMRTSG